MQADIKKCVKQQELEREKITQDVEKSLVEIKEKIKQFRADIETRAVEKEKLTAELATYKSKLEQMKERFSTESNALDEQVKGEKDQLMEKISSLQSEMMVQQAKNKELMQIEKENIEKKLSIFIRAKKFGELVSALQSTAKSVDQCKQQLVKAVQRIVKADL